MRRLLIVVLLGGVAVASVLATAGSSSTDSRSSVSWSGKWRRAANEIDAGGPTLFRLKQSGTRLTGTLPWRGCTTKEGGILVGFATGRNAVAATRQTDGTLVSMHMQLSPDGRRISGGYTVTAGTCAASGPFDATRVP